MAGIEQTHPLLEVEMPNIVTHNPCTGYGDIKLYAGTACPDLANKIAQHLGLPLSGRDISLFPNDNLFVRLHHSVRGQDVYVIQTTSRPVHQNLMELLILMQTMRLDSAGRITAVVPYLCYARSDKTDQPRVPITARLVCDMIEIAGADRYMTLDLHAGQIQGFFSIPGDVLSAYHIITAHLRSMLPELKDPVVVTADLGFAKKGRNLAAGIGASIAFVEKRRFGDEEHLQTEALTLIGSVDGHDVIIVDDEVDTGGSMAQAALLAKEKGARDVYLVFVHPILSNPAVERLEAAPVVQIITTDTVPIPEEKRDRLGEKLTILSVAPLLGEVIRRAHEGRSVGEMFNE
jgi:ribose-phosphate pyrophosphokinase